MVIDNEIVCCIFAGNNTSHASHLNSAPGLVFDFYRAGSKLVNQ
jgi:hypothetical protein